MRRANLAGEAWLLDSKKSLYGLAVTRILFGLTGVGLLLSNFSSRLYTFGSGSAWNGEAAEPVSAFTRIWLFSLFDSVRLDDTAFTVLYLLLLALAVAFTIGWRFKVVLPVYLVLWISFIEMNDAVGDQGDNMYRIALLLMLFADPAARWSLDARRRRLGGDRTLLPREIGSLLHNLALVALTAQVSFVYVSGALYKAGGAPWSEGYAVYNPLMTERFGTWPVLSELVTAWGPAVTLLSWGSIIIQLAFPFMLLTRPTRIVALMGIMSFHIGIAVLMGLPWFSLAMIGIDFIFVRDRTWRAVADAVADALASARRAGPGPAPRAAPASAGERAPAPAAEEKPVGHAEDELSARDKEETPRSPAVL
ncbi:HTTM domain-containing protein [Microbacterium betulae]|uniref:HTTM domain-containing protein n=1 Tax=Microbacterium betulae TaxID=2981139 RepID=A0AA97I8K7_9MICO|nr:HTTM domain-containing protein [Microbacterium sp. AB]WOF24767.1 HTTM domain-containing protein [Microbacterium sp. AB]